VNELQAQSTLCACLLQGPKINRYNRKLNLLYLYTETAAHRRMHIDYKAVNANANPISGVIQL